jgi:hypothetical protein
MNCLTSDVNKEGAANDVTKEENLDCHNSLLVILWKSMVILRHQRLYF